VLILSALPLALPLPVWQERRELKDFFGELKRRNVYKVAAAYAVVAWLLIQAASIFFPAFDAPPWVMTAFIIVSVLCFTVALVLSWAFQITPERIKRESEVAPNQSTTARSGRRINAITVALAVVAAGLMTFQLLRPKSTAAADYSSSLQIRLSVHAR
jgi:hypothetical protein